MTPDTVICVVNMFDRNQTLYQTIPGVPDLYPIGTVTVEELPDAVINYCIGNNLNKIHFYGNDGYIQEIVDYMKKITYQTYDLNDEDIIVEVN